MPMPHTVLLLAHSFCVAESSGAGAASTLRRSSGAVLRRPAPVRACVDSSGAPIAATYCDPHAPVASRVADLIGRMNATEKTAFLSKYQTSGSCSAPACQAVPCAGTSARARRSSPADAVSCPGGEDQRAAVAAVAASAAACDIRAYSDRLLVIACDF